MSLDDKISFVQTDEKIHPFPAVLRFPSPIQWELSVIENARKEIQRAESSIHSSVRDIINSYNEGLITAYEMGMSIADSAKASAIYANAIGLLWEAQQDYTVLRDHGGISPEKFDAAIQAAFNAGKAEGLATRK